MFDACVLVESDAYMSKDLGQWMVTEHPPCTYSYFCHTLAALVAFLGINCDAAWRHGRTYSGVICDLGWSLVNMVLLHWSCQSDSQSASQFEEKARREWRHAGQERSLTERQEDKYSLQSITVHRNAQWCGISPEACRLELGERGPNVTLATLKSVPVNYHKRHDDHCWTVESSEKTTLLV